MRLNVSSAAMRMLYNSCLFALFLIRYDDKYMRSIHSRFINGFLFGILLFAASNLYSYYMMPEESSMADGFVSFGVPFEVYSYGGFYGHSVILWEGIVANIFIALGSGVICAYAFENLLRTPSRLP